MTVDTRAKELEKVLKKLLKATDNSALCISQSYGWSNAIAEFREAQQEARQALSLE